MWGGVHGFRPLRFRMLKLHPVAVRVSEVLPSVRNGETCQQRQSAVT